MRTLIVADHDELQNDLTRFCFERQVLRHGTGADTLRILTAQTGEQALALAADPETALVWLDYYVPGLYGLPLVQGLREVCPQAILMVLSTDELVEGEMARFSGLRFALKPMMHVQKLVADLTQELVSGLAPPHLNSPS